MDKRFFVMMCVYCEEASKAVPSTWYIDNATSENGPMIPAPQARLRRSEDRTAEA